MASFRISPELIDRSFGLISTVENRRVMLPLKAVECEFSVVAGLVEVRMTQVFRQENPKPLDCDYLFPLPADAAVYSCEADFNGRVIRAIVKERGEAVRLAQEKKAEGKRVALVESERENLLTLSLKNLQPDDLVLITLKYIQPLRHLADMPSVEIPFCPGIRYIPGNPLIRSNRGQGIVDDTDQVPDASRISPVRMDQEHPDASFIEILGRLDGKFVNADALVSPSHNIISRPEGDDVVIGLSDKGEVPDRDFVLRWKESKPDTLTARAWIQETGEETYALIEIRAPKASGPAVPMDFYFLVDQSGSMSGVKWQKAALAVQTSVSKLMEGDRVTGSASGIFPFPNSPR
jgi:Ca-activated chloride channel family protein